jgi:hypothetical protein
MALVWTFSTSSSAENRIRNEIENIDKISKLDTTPVSGTRSVAIALTIAMISVLVSLVLKDSRIGFTHVRICDSFGLNMAYMQL